MSVTTDATDIRPFDVDFPAEAVDDLRRRIQATRWPERETVADTTQGVQLATMQALARYWGTEYDFGRVEARLNAFPQFMTEIDGLDIHFIHVRVAARERAADHHHPRLAGLGRRDAERHRPAHRPDGARRRRRGRVPRRGSVDARLRVLGQADGDRLGSRHIARAWIALMKRLGYTRYVAQGGDWGAPDHRRDGCARRLRSCSASTPTCPARFRRTSSTTVSAGDPAPSGLSAEETGRTSTCASSTRRASATRPRWRRARRRCTGLRTRRSLWRRGCSTTTRRATRTSRARSSTGNPVGNLTRDEVLDNITLTWLTNTGISSARLYWENTLGFFDVKGSRSPPR